MNYTDYILYILHEYAGVHSDTFIKKAVTVENVEI